MVTDLLVPTADTVLLLGYGTEAASPHTISATGAWTMFGAYL